MTVNDVLNFWCNYIDNIETMQPVYKITLEQAQAKINYFLKHTDSIMPKDEMAHIKLKYI